MGLTKIFRFEVDLILVIRELNGKMPNIDYSCICMISVLKFEFKLKGFINLVSKDIKQ